jgi:uncharacterized iron-regulated membrane protein
MAADDIVWPVGTTAQDPDLADRPVLFRPKGFLVAILPDADEAGRAAAALRAAGFADRTLRIFTGEQILADYARYTARQNLPRRAVAAVADDAETLELYHGHARDGQAALWVHVSDDDEANRAIRGLADFPTLHIRHYGHGRQTDFRLRRPTANGPIDTEGGTS